MIIIGNKDTKKIFDPLQSQCKLKTKFTDNF